MDLKSVGMALIVVVIWGMNFSFIKFGLEELPPVLFSALRFLVVAIPAVFFIPFPKTAIGNVIGVGVFLGVLKFSLLFIAMQHDASAGLSSLILQSQVLFTILLSVLILRETVTLNQKLGIAIAGTGFCGFLFLDQGGATPLGVTLILTAGFFWAISNLIMKQVKGVNLLHFMVWASLIPPLPLLLLSYFTESQQPLALLTNMSLQSWMSIAYVGYISTLVAFALWGHLLSRFDAATVTPFALLIPVVGMFGAHLLLGEHLSLWELASGLVVMAGLCVIVFGSKRLKKRASKINPVSDSSC